MIEKLGKIAALFALAVLFLLAVQTNGAGAAGIGALCLVIGGGLVVRAVFRQSSDRAETEAEQRMRKVIAQGALGDDPLAAPIVDEPSRGANFLDRIAGRIAESETLKDEEGQNMREKIDEQLIRAGIRHQYSPEQAMAIALLCWTIGVIAPLFLVLAINLPKFIALIVIAFFAAYPVLKLRGLVRARQDSIRAEIPFFIQQLYMAISSGMSTIDDAIQRVARNAEDDPYDSLLAREFAQANTEYRVGGRNQEDALRDVGYRTGVTSVQNLVEALIQGQRTGAEMEKVLLEYSETAREMWRQDMRNYKNKKEPLVTLGLVITMFGAFIILATPMVIGLLRTLQGF